MATGAVVILPPYFEETFGNGALYAKPSDVELILNEYVHDPDKYLAQSAAAMDFARSFGSEKHIDRLTSLDVTLPVESSAQMPLRKKTDKRVLFITSNGVGMGHLTRLLAIARQLPTGAQPIFASLSAGVPVVARYGMPFEYIMSKDGSGLEQEAWNAYALWRFSALLEEVAPDTVVFDGVWPYRPLRQALQSANVESVWMRRGMWKPMTSPRALAWSRDFSRIIEPGEFAAEYDAGPTASAIGMPVDRIDPVTLLPASEVLARERARSELGYGHSEKIALVTLGAGNINGIDEMQDATIAWFAQNEPDWRVVLTKPPIAEKESKRDFDSLQVYPLAKYTAAFDISISAAGYNAFHEWMMGELPTIWVPNLQTKTDDQLARARWAQDRGMGLAVLDDSLEMLARQLSKLTNDRFRDQVKNSLRSLNKSNGAGQAAKLIVGEVQ